MDKKDVINLGSYVFYAIKNDKSSNTNQEIRNNDLIKFGK